MFALFLWIVIPMSLIYCLNRHCQNQKLVFPPKFATFYYIIYIDYLSNAFSNTSETTSASYTEASTSDSATTTQSTTAALPKTTPESTSPLTYTSTQTAQYGMFQIKGSVDSRLPTHVLVTQGARSVIDCARLCAFSEECQSFNYREDASNGSCELNTMKIPSILQLIPATGYTYWEK